MAYHKYDNSADCNADAQAMPHGWAYRIIKATQGYVLYYWCITPHSVLIAGSGIGCETCGRCL